MGVEAAEVIAERSMDEEDVEAEGQLVKLEILVQML